MASRRALVSGWCLMVSGAFILMTVLWVSESPPVNAQAMGVHDPGVRPGPADAGGPLIGLTATELSYFNQGKDAFEEEDGVAQGLGPRFNLDSCAGCHAQPAVGGSSPMVNPQVAVATKSGARNNVPCFIT